MNANNKALIGTISFMLTVIILILKTKGIDLYYVIVVSLPCMVWSLGSLALTPNSEKSSKHKYHLRIYHFFKNNKNTSMIKKSVLGYYFVAVVLAIIAFVICFFTGNPTETSLIITACVVTLWFGYAMNHFSGVYTLEIRLLENENDGYLKQLTLTNKTIADLKRENVEFKTENDTNNLTIVEYTDVINKLREELKDAVDTENRMINEQYDAKNIYLELEEKYKQLEASTQKKTRKPKDVEIKEEVLVESPKS